MKKWPPCKISWRDPIVANSYASTRKDPSKQYPMSSTTFSCFSLDTKDTCIRQPQKKQNWISLEIWLQKLRCICMSPCRYIYWTMVGWHLNCTLWRPTTLYQSSQHYKLQLCGNILEYDATFQLMSDAEAQQKQNPICIKVGSHACERNSASGWALASNFLIAATRSWSVA